MEIHNGGASMKYLIVAVDDSKFMHKIIEKLFDPELFEVHFFISAEEAKKALNASPLQGREVDIVLLDIYLEDGNKEASIGLLEFLTNQRKRTQVIVMSGRLSSDEFAEFYFKGADSYLLKPFTEEKFMSSVKRHINIARHIPVYNNGPLAKIKVNERDVFISSLSTNKKLASFFSNELMKNNIGSCCENAELLGDDIWGPVLTEAINTCKIFILLFTHDTLQSDYMKQEIIQAFNRKKRDGNRFFLIPVLYDIKPIDIPKQINSMHCVDISSANKRADHIRSLIFSIKKILKVAN
ncbi:MAG: response regulator [Candidatus Electrothrix sp. AR5]|nr:response regulator [Candidatus Electrothrix sp. AR5]